MSSNNINKQKSKYSRTFFYTSKKNQSKKKKVFNYPKNKNYVKEKDSSPPRKENYLDDDSYQANNYDIEIIYEDEYQGLMYQPKHPEISSDIYYIEKETKDEFNNFKSKWKTEICRYWEMYGECKFGDYCAFAHGDSELKQRKLTFNYKTKPCKQFFESGYCTYGSRCQFSHKKEDSIKLKNDKGNMDNEVSYLKIINELLSEDNKISHELVKRPRLRTFENITHSTLEESENSKLKLYEDIINLKNEKLKKENNNNFKLSDDTNSNSNASSDGANEKDF